MKTRLYNFDPLKPHFYIVKLGFTGVYIIFLISAQNIDCEYLLELPRWGGSNEYLQSMFWAEIWKISEFFYLKIFSFWRWNFLYIWIGMFMNVDESFSSLSHLFRGKCIRQRQTEKKKVFPSWKFWSFDGIYLINAVQSFPIAVLEKIAMKSSQILPLLKDTFLLGMAT